MSDIIKLVIKKVDGEFVIGGLYTLGQATEVLGYSSSDSIYKAIARGDIRRAYVSPGHKSKNGLLFKKDVLALKKKRAEKLKKRLKKLESE